MAFINVADKISETDKDQPFDSHDGFKLGAGTGRGNNSK